MTDTFDAIMDAAAAQILAGAEVAAAFRQPGIAIDAAASAGGLPELTPAVRAALKRTAAITNPNDPADTMTIR